MNFFNKILIVFIVSLPIQLIAQFEDTGFSLFGKEFELNSRLDDPELFNKLAVTDSVKVQLKGEILDVCQKKGCWMKVQLNEDKEVFVRFKDYGFFVPKNSSEKTTIINGVAFVEEMSVEDQRHYAEDKGVSESEINKITEPKRTFRFEADGVLIKE